MMRTIGWTAVVAGVLAFSGPALAQSCGGFFHTASEKQITTAQSAPLQTKPVDQDKKG
jgi:hypothetical protein